MRLTSSILAVAACLSAAACASSEPTGGSAASNSSLAALARAEPDKMICTREHVVGSHRPEKVCLTARQRLELAERSKEQLEQVRSRYEEAQKPGGI